MIVRPDRVVDDRWWALDSGVRRIVGVRVFAPRAHQLRFRVVYEGDLVGHLRVEATTAVGADVRPLDLR